MLGHTITYLTQDNSVYPDLDLTSNGRYVKFVTPSSSGSTGKIFIKDMQSGALQNVWAEQESYNFTYGEIFHSAISDDGNSIAFSTLQANLVAADPAIPRPGSMIADLDVFVKDLAHNSYQLVSANAKGERGNDYSVDPSISSDGKYVAFTSNATNLLGSDITSTGGVFVKNLATGGIVLASSTSNGTAANGGGSHPLLSANGRYVAFFTSASNLYSGYEGNEGKIFLKDLQTGELKPVSIPSSTVYHYLVLNSISADGRYVAFSSGNTDSSISVYVRDTSTGQLQRASENAYGVALHDDSSGASLSADGHSISFISNASNLVPGDTNGVADVFIKNLQTGGITRVSTTPDGTQANAASDQTVMAADGFSVLYRTAATNLSSGSTGKNWLKSNISNLDDNSGNNRITLEANGDSVDGGSGLDTVIYTGLRGNFSVSKQSTSIAVTDQQTHASNSLVNVERLQFNDSAIAYDLAGSAGKAYRIYQAALDRAPDLTGLGFWINTMDKGAALADVANGFMQSPEFQSLYGSNPSNATLVNKFYDHVLHRAPDADGYQFWLNLLDKHNATPAEVLAAFSESPENQAALTGVISNGMAFVPFV